jgi:nicotinamidase-related amidase
MLIVVDVQNDFLDTWPEKKRACLVRGINDLAHAVREHGGSVIWVRQEFAPDLTDAFLAMRRDGFRLTIRGTRGAQFAPELRIMPGETEVIKTRYSAFFGTTLEQHLQEITPGALLIAGINTHACVRMTAIDAYQRDYCVIVASDCVGSYDDEHHAISLKYLDGNIAHVLTSAEIIGAMKAAMNIYVDGNQAHG